MTFAEHIYARSLGDKTYSTKYRTLFFAVHATLIVSTHSFKFTYSVIYPKCVKMHWIHKGVFLDINLSLQHLVEL